MKKDGRAGIAPSRKHQPSRVFTACGFRLRYHAAVRESLSRGLEPTGKEIAERLARSRSTLYRLRVDYDCPRGSHGMSGSELEELRRKDEQT